MLSEDITTQRSVAILIGSGISGVLAFGMFKTNARG